MALRVDIACGGTGGHVIPGLTVGRALKARGHRVSLWLSGRDVEGTAVGGWDGPVQAVSAAGLPSGVKLASAARAFGLLRAAFACRRRMAGDPPDVLMAMGSYASVGPVLAAWSRRIPVVLHEANAVPGRAVSLLARCATKVAVTFGAASAFLPRGRTVLTGFPVRCDLDTQFEPGSLDPAVFTVLVMGGSLGAHRVNELASDAICRAHARGVSLQVVHLAGEKDEAGVRTVYEEAGVPHLVFGFLREVGKAYNASDLAIARAGAASCMELAACGLPALLVPYPSAARDHQAANACALAAAGAADTRREDQLTAEWLTDYVARHAADRRRLDTMRVALQAMAEPQATEKIVALLESVAGGRAAEG